MHCKVGVGPESLAAGKVPSCNKCSIIHNYCYVSALQTVKQSRQMLHSGAFPGVHNADQDNTDPGKADSASRMWELTLSYL